MPTYDVYFDSRDRISGTAADATFQLTHPLSNVRSVYVRSFQFQNTFYNITSTTNQFGIDTGTNIVFCNIPPGMYNSTSIVETLNRLIAAHGTVSLSGNILSWYTGTKGIKKISTTTLGLNGYLAPNIHGTIETVLSLASLSYVSLSSASIQPAQRAISCSPQSMIAPLITCPLSTEIGFIQSNVEFFPAPIMCNNHALQTISFQVNDPYSKRLLTDLQSWAAQICFQAD